MEVKIVTKKWKLDTDDNGTKKISGEYEIKCGASKIAESTFNGSYSSTTAISFPVELMTEVEALDAKVRQAIIDNITN